MVMSELIGGVDGAGLLVFLGCSTKGCYIDPDQQGDIRIWLFLNLKFEVTGFVVILCCFLKRIFDITWSKKPVNSNVRAVKSNLQVLHIRY